MTDPHIGTLNEGSLHAALKSHYAEPGDEFEVPLDRFVIDIRRGDRLIEIQTTALAAMGHKLDHLLPSYHILIVHPIPIRTRLQRPEKSPRRSPKKLTIYNLFDELVGLPTLLDHPNLTIDICLVEVTKVQVADPKARRGRGGFRTVDRVLDELIATEHFETTDDLRRLIPEALPATFTTADLADGAAIRRDVAQRMAYCFRALGIFEELGRDRSGIQYRVS